MSRHDLRLGFTFCAKYTQNKYIERYNLASLYDSNWSGRGDGENWEKRQNTNHGVTEVVMSGNIVNFPLLDRKAVPGHSHSWFCL